VGGRIINYLKGVEGLREERRGCYHHQYS